MVEHKSEIFALLAEHEEQLRRFGVKRWGLFGSFVDDRASNRSDVDILVEFEQGKKSFDNFMHLAAFREKQIGRRVELLTPESLSPHILREVEYASSRS